MKRLVIFAFVVATPTLAAMGVLVGSHVQTVGGQYYTVCTYNVGGTMINQMLPGPQVCPPSINM